MRRNNALFFCAKRIAMQYMRYLQAKIMPQRDTLK